MVQSRSESESTGFFCSTVHPVFTTIIQRFTTLLARVFSTDKITDFLSNVLRRLQNSLLGRFLLKFFALFFIKHEMGILVAVFVQILF